MSSAIHVYPDIQAWQQAAVAHAIDAHQAGRPQDFRILNYTNAAAAACNAGLRPCIYGLDAAPFVAGERLITLDAVKDPNLAGDAPPLYGSSRELTVLEAAPFVFTDLPELSPPAEGLSHWLIPPPLPTELPAWTLRVEADGDDSTNTITAIDPAARGALDAWLNRLSAEAKAPGGRWWPFWNLKERFAQLSPHWAITTHRSQGSQYRDVFLNAPDLDSNRDDRERNRLWYVALTRATHAVHLLADQPPPDSTAPAAPIPAAPGPTDHRRDYIRSLATLQQHAHRNAFTTHQVAVAAGDGLPVERTADDRQHNEQAIAIHQPRIDWLVANGLLEARRHFPRVAVRIPPELGQEQSEKRLKQLERSCSITLYCLTTAGLQEAAAG
jgi:hypothetical protein